MGSSRLREVSEAELSLYAMYIRNPLYGHPLNTDASLFRQFSLSPWKVLTFSVNPTHLPRTPFEVDNGHLFLTPGGGGGGLPYETDGDARRLA